MKIKQNIFYLSSHIFNFSGYLDKKKGVTRGKTIPCSVSVRKIMVGIGIHCFFLAAVSNFHIRNLFIFFKFLIFDLHNTYLSKVCSLRQCCGVHLNQEWSAYIHQF